MMIFIGLLVVAGGLFVLLANRKYVLLTLLFISCFVTLGQQVKIGDFHFYALRIIFLFGLVRIIIRNEFLGLKLIKIDYLFFLWAIYSSIIYILLWQSYAAVINRMGFIFNALGCYLLCRTMIRNQEDIHRLLSGLAYFIIVLGSLFLLEWVTGKNPFSLFGGVPEYTTVREGMLRCQGPFRHPIMAGTFGATQFILCFYLFIYSRKKRLLGIMSSMASLIIIFSAGSSGGLLTLIFGILGLSLWVVRNKIRMIELSFCIGIIVLHLLMKAPVWYLFARLGNVFGGTGWHRAYLIDQAIAHFGDWWLIGTQNTSDWMPYGLASNPDVADITNQYIQEGINGGLLSIIFFIALIMVCFRALQNPFSLHQRTTSPKLILLWFLLVSLFQHSINFLSIPYFDQMFVFWYLLLALIATIISPSFEWAQTGPALSPVLQPAINSSFAVKNTSS